MCRGMDREAFVRGLNREFARARASSGVLGRSRRYPWPRLSPSRKSSQLANHSRCELLELNRRFDLQAFRAARLGFWRHTI
jgi:hypothetical protein